MSPISIDTVTPSLHIVRRDRERLRKGASVTISNGAASIELNVADHGLDALSPRERINDTERGSAMLEYMRQGKLKYHAARLACAEYPSGPSDSSCARRLVRKYHAGRFDIEVRSG